MWRGLPTRRLILVSGMIAGLGLSGGAAVASSCGSHASMDIVDTAANAGSFETLVAAVQAAGLVEALQGEGPFTVFAPTDEAFARLPAGTLDTLLEPENRELLTSILTYHVAPGRLSARDVIGAERVRTLNGQRPAINVEGHRVMIDEANIIQTDIDTSNGIIHVIDRVILPSQDDIVATAIKAGSFDTLAAALQAAGLVAALQGEGPFTVFAPTDEAFARLPRGTVNSLLEPENKDRLAAILKYHVVAGNLYSTDAADGARVETLEGSDVRLSVDGDGLKVDRARVISTDIAAANGVIHVIDRVIMPGRDDSAEAGAMRVIELAIAKGVPLYNQGQPAACTAVYQTAARALLDLGAETLTDHEQDRLTRAMSEVERTHGSSSRAWVMRHALDEVYASLRQRADDDPMATLDR